MYNMAEGTGDQASSSNSGTVGSSSQEASADSSSGPIQCQQNQNFGLAPNSLEGMKVFDTNIKYKRRR